MNDAPVAGSDATAVNASDADAGSVSKNTPPNSAALVSYCAEASYPATVDGAVTAIETSIACPTDTLVGAVAGNDAAVPSSVPASAGSATIAMPHTSRNAATTTRMVFVMALTSDFLVLTVICFSSRP